MKLARILRNSYVLVGLITGILAAVAMLPTIIHCGGMFMMRGDDFVQQQVGFILESKRLIASGSPWWSPLIGLGNNAIASFSYYTFGSPFFWLLVPFPNHCIPYMMSVIYIVKFIVAAVTCFWAARFFLPKRASALAAILYAFSGFSIVNLQFQFMDTVALFPLLIVGIEMLVRKCRYGVSLLILAIAMNVLTNFYLFVGQSIFCGLYILWRILFNNEYHEHRWKLMARIFACYVVGVGMSSVLLVPTVTAMVGNPRAEAPARHLLGWVFFHPLRYLELFRAILMPSETAARHTFYPSTNSWTSTGIFLPAFGFVMVMAYVLKARSWLRNLLITCFVISMVPFANAAFTLYTMPLYTRWWYMLAFLMAVAMADVFLKQDEAYRKTIIKCLIVSVLIIVLITVPFGLVVLYPNILSKLAAHTGIHWFTKYSDQMTSDKMIGNRLYIGMAWGLCIANIFALLCIHYAYRSYKVVMGAVCAAAAVNMIGFLFIDNREVFNGLGVYAHPIDVRYIVDKEIKNLPMCGSSNQYSWRIDYPRELRNYSLFANLPSPNVFTSIRSSSVADFQAITGCGDPRYPDFIMPYDQPALRPLLSVKYYINYDPRNIKHVPEGFDLVERKQGYAIYSNRYFVPMGFTYDTYIPSDYIAGNHKISAMMMLCGVALNPDQINRLNRYLKPASCDVTKGYVQLAGERQKDLSSNACHEFVMSSDGFKTKINLTKPRLAFFSIPWDKGWRATVDKRDVEIEKVNFGFMGLMLPSGKHDIHFTYHPPGFILGCTLSLLFVAVWMISIATAKRRPSLANVVESP